MPQASAHPLPARPSRKTSALGQIASHLIDGLQGPVVDLRAVVANHGNTETCTVDWRSTSDYADRLQQLIATTVALLGDSGTATTDQLTGTELLAIIGRRMAGPARDRTVRLTQGPAFAATLDRHRGTVFRITLAVGSSRSINVCIASSTI